MRPEGEPGPTSIKPVCAKKLFSLAAEVGRDDLKRICLEHLSASYCLDNIASEAFGDHARLHEETATGVVEWIAARVVAVKQSPGWKEAMRKMASQAPLVVGQGVDVQELIAKTQWPSVLQAKIELAVSQLE